jgi:hypothetical protein
MDRCRLVGFLAVLAVLADVTLTRIVVGSAHATETNPVSAWLITTGGWATWAAVATTAVVSALALGRWLERHGRSGWPARVVALAPGAAALSNTAGVLATDSWPATVAWGDVVGLVGVVLAVVAGGVVVAERHRVRAVVSGLSVPRVSSADRPLVVASVLLVVLSAVLAGVPASVFGPGAPAGAVDRVAAASVFDDGFEDGDISEWDTGTAGDMAAKQDVVYEGSYSAGGSGDSSADLIKRSFTTDVDNISVAVYIGSHPSSRVDVWKVADDSGNGIATFEIKTDGSIVYWDGDKRADLGFDHPAGDWYIYDYSPDYQNNEFDLFVYASNGTLVQASKNNPNRFDGTSGRNDPEQVYLEDGAGETDTRFDNVIVGGTASFESTVSGTVTDSDGNAISGANVNIEDSNGNQVADLETNSSGYYSTSLASGDYTITASKADYESASKDITVSGSAVTADLSLTYIGGEFDYTLGVCYSTAAEFDASTGEADLLRRYLTDGTHPDSKLPDRSTDVIAGTIREENGPSPPTAFAAVFERVLQGEAFNYKNNVTATVTDPDASPYTWGLRAEIETNRAYYDLHGIDPSAARPYDQFVFAPPFGSEEDGRVLTDAQESVDNEACREDATTGDGGTPTPVATPPGNDSTNLRPTALFTYEPLLPNTTSTVQFEADASDPDGSIEQYRWRFPAGKATGPTPTYTFEEGGDRPVQLTVIDDDGANATYTAEVYVSNASNGPGTANLPPSAYFTYEPIAPTAGTDVTFTADATDTDGEIANYSWRIDGEPVTTGETMTVAFDGPGTREVSLLATDDDNATARYDVSVYVQANDSGTTNPWPEDDPTALGTCSLPAANGTTQTGLLLEYWDSDYETVALDTTISWNGSNYTVSKTFDEPKGYYFGCIGVGEDVSPDDDGDPSAETNVTYENGTEDSFNDTGIDDYSPENALGGSGGFSLGGGGPLIGEGAGSGAPTFLTALPALAAIGVVAYRRWRGGGGSGGGGAGAGAGGSGGGSSGGVLGRLRGRG